MTITMSNAYERLILSQDLKQCAICSRQFSSNRIKAHENICRKSSVISRKPFDVSEQRLRGTDVAILSSNKLSDGQIETQKSGLSTNWRWKHEDFIRNIKAIKKCNNEKSKRQNDIIMMPPVEFAECVKCPYCFIELSKLAVESHLSSCLAETGKRPKSKGSLSTNSKTARKSQASAI